MIADRLERAPQRFLRGSQIVAIKACTFHDTFRFASAPWSRRNASDQRDPRAFERARMHRSVIAIAAATVLISSMRRFATL